MAHTQSLDTWSQVFALVEAAAQHHQAAGRLERLATSSDPEARADLASRARIHRRLGDEANAHAENIRKRRYEDDPS